MTTKEAREIKDAQKQVAYLSLCFKHNIKLSFLPLGEENQLVVKCLAQGHKCRDRESHPHTSLTIKGAWINYVTGMPHSKRKTKENQHALRFLRNRPVLRENHCTWCRPTWEPITGALNSLWHGAVCTLSTVFLIYSRSLIKHQNFNFMFYM